MAYNYKRETKRTSERRAARAEGVYGAKILGVVLRHLRRERAKDKVVIRFIESLIIGQERKVTRNGGKL